MKNLNWRFPRLFPAIGIVLLVVNQRANAQELILRPLESNPVLSGFAKRYPDYKWGNGTLHKWGLNDTLELPFFEDFTAFAFFPDSSKFTDNQVYVNRHFGVKPPSFGVATFDFLDDKGSPYQTLQRDLRGGGDTLSSQAVRLSSKNGSPLTPADSVYFSFYYQARGMGDYIKPQDSLILEFLDSGGSWVRIWDSPGSGYTVFAPVIIRLDSLKFFHPGFRFRFRNWTHYWGNNNHWHIDHIYLDAGRRGAIVSTDDYTIQTPPSNMLKRYASMPFDHYLANPAQEREDSSLLRIANLNASPITALVRNEYFINGVLIGSTNLSDNSGILQARSDAQRSLPIPAIGSAQGFLLIVDRYYYVKESGRTNPEPFTGSDQIHTTQVFDRYFAYDDGSAESGFGFNDLAGRIGKVAVRFELNKPDTLRGVGFCFTHNIAVLGDVRYDVQVWRSIARPGQVDDLAYEYSARGTYHTGEINGYHYFIFPEPVILDAGEFYVGWSQGDDFNLTVGFDKNGGNLYQGLTVNKDIYFNVGDGWMLNNSGDLVGAPMIRPLVGPAAPYTASVPEPARSGSALRFFPNPSTGLLHVHGSPGEDFFEVYGADGRLIRTAQVSDGNLDLRDLNPGFYRLVAVTKRTGQCIILY